MDGLGFDHRGLQQKLGRDFCLSAPWKGGIDFKLRGGSKNLCVSLCRRQGGFGVWFSDILGPYQAVVGQGIFWMGGAQ